MFASIVALAHMIPPAEFGRAAVALILPPLALSVAFQGFGSALVQRDSVRRGHVETAAFLSILLGAGSTIVVYKLAPHLIPLYGYRIADLFQLASPVLLLSGFAAAPQALLQRNLDFRRLSLSEVGGLIAGSATSVALALVGLDAKALVLGAVAMVATTAGLMWASAKMPLPRLRRGCVRAIVGFGTPASLESLLHASFRNIDYVILGATLGPAQVGFYHRAFQMGMEYQGKITGIMSRMAFPVYSRTATLADMRNLRARITRLHAIIVLPLLAGLVALAPVFVPALFGARWEPAVEPVQILAAGGAFAALISGTGPLILAAGKPHALVVYNGVRILVYGGAVWWAASRGGLIAVCFAVVAVQAAGLAAAQYFLLKRIVGIPVRQLWDDAVGALLGCVALLAVALPLTRLMMEADLPSLVTLGVVGSAGMAAYLLTLRILFHSAWKDLALVGRRMLARRSGRHERREPLANAGVGG